MFAQFATGVCILLLEDATMAKGLTINSFSSLSLDPLLINFSLKVNSRFYLDFEQDKNFSINILSAHQQSLAKKCSVPGGATLSTPEVVKNEVYYIPDSIVSLFCRVKETVRGGGGDHMIFVCDVFNMSRNKSDPPLLFFDSQYRFISA